LAESGTSAIAVPSSPATQTPAVEQQWQQRALLQPGLQGSRASHQIGIHLFGNHLQGLQALRQVAIDLVGNRRHHRQLLFAQQALHIGLQAAAHKERQRPDAQHKNRQRENGGASSQ
jgi:hypothetical protein